MILFIKDAVLAAKACTYFATGDELLSGAKTEIFMSFRLLKRSD